LNNEDFKELTNLIAQYSNAPGNQPVDEFSNRVDDKSDKIRQGEDFNLRNITSSKDYDKLNYHQNLNQTLSSKQNKTDIYSNLDHKTDQNSQQGVSDMSSTTNSSNLSNQQGSNKNDQWSDKDNQSSTNKSDQWSDKKKDKEDNDKKDEHKDKSTDRAPTHL